MPDGKICLKSFRNKMFFDVDTAEIKDGKFTFKGEVDQFYYSVWQPRSMNYPVNFLGEYGYGMSRSGMTGRLLPYRYSPVNDVFQKKMQEKVFEEGSILTV